MPLFAQCIDHAPLDGPAASPTDGDAHLVMARQAVELTLQLSGVRGQLLPRRQHRTPSGTVPPICRADTALLWLNQTTQISGDFLCAPPTGPGHGIPAQACRKCLCSVQLASLDKGLFLLTPPKADCVSGASIEGIPEDSGVLSFSLLSLLSFFFSLPSSPAPTLQSSLFPHSCI